jgi:hypothetical protein
MGVMEKKTAEENIQTVSDALADLEADVKDSKAYLDLEKTVAEISRLRGKLRQELAVIRLRRIVPGRCRYCPI